MRHHKSELNAQAAPQLCFQLGASLIEFIVVAPTLLMMILGVLQTGMVFHAKSNLNYAAFEAARTGTVSHGSLNAMQAKFTAAMAGYYGGGRNPAELAVSLAKATADITLASTQIQILSPTVESFDDYASPKLKSKLGVNTRVIPNANIANLNCPNDNPGCNSNPASNASGQTLADANLLKIKIIYGIPQSKQIPLVGRFYVFALKTLFPQADPFKQALLAQGRIPITLSTVMRMQSEPFEDGNASIPGAGNNAPVNTNPEDEDDESGNTGDDGVEECDPDSDLDACLPPGCKAGDSSCDPSCRNKYCCMINGGFFGNSSSGTSSGVDIFTTLTE